MQRIAGLIFILSLLPIAAGDEPMLPGSEAHIYKTVDDVELKMWVYRPEAGSAAERDDASSTSPAVVFFFGGGWKQGTPKQFEHHCRYLSSRGISILPSTSGKPDRFRAQSR